MLDVDITGMAGENRLEISLSVQDSGCLALAGPSGAGKTTLLRMIAGLVRPESGQIKLGRRTLFDSEAGIDVLPELRGCGFMFQDYALFPHLSAWRNVAYCVNGSRDERRSVALNLLERLGAGSLADTRPGELSGGERQRVALARAIASEPDLLLLDEPIGALDVSTRTLAANEITAAVADLRVPALLVTHDFHEAALLGNSVAVLEGSGIVQSGSASELTANPQTVFVADLTGSNLLRGVAQTRADGLTEVALDRGGSVLSVDPADGPATLSIQPWEIVLESSASDGAVHSMQNRLRAEVTSLTTVGNRVRVGLALPQPLVAEVTEAAVATLELRPGIYVAASFKASAARLYTR